MRPSAQLFISDRSHNVTSPVFQKTSDDARIHDQHLMSIGIVSGDALKGWISPNVLPEACGLIRHEVR